MRVLLGAAALAMLSLATSAAGPPAAPDYFPLHERDVWRYRNTDAKGKTSEFIVTVVGTEKEKDGAAPFLVQTLVDGKRVLDWYLKSKGWVVHLRQFPMGAAGPTELKPPKKALKNPPHVGDKWTWKGTGGGVPSEVSSEVLDEADVTVPAGTFHASRILTRTTRGGVTVSRMQWYAAGVGMVRAEAQLEGRTTATDLMEYHGHP
jgi:hypothetical protein